MGRTIEDLQADIEAGVGELVAGEGWQRWLAVAAKFPKYSFRNQLLILAQRPEARVVMGYRAWQALGHQVRKGETVHQHPRPLHLQGEDQHCQDGARGRHDGPRPGR